MVELYLHQNSLNIKHMKKEGSTEAPVRHPIDFEHPDFLDPEKLDTEMRRVFDICHGCRRCFNLCDSFPKLFDMIDQSKGEDVDMDHLKIKSITVDGGPVFKRWKPAAYGRAVPRLKRTSHLTVVISSKES